MVAVILVNYKDYVNRFLAECRDSLRTQDYPDDLFNVYIVDNASSEESRDYIKNHYKEAIVIPREDGNYAAANNAGIKKAIEDGCEYFVIANMDTYFDKSWLSELVKAIESENNIGIAQSKILIYPKDKNGEWEATPRTQEIDKKLKINSVGNMLHFLGFGFSQGDGKEDYAIKGYLAIKGYASGCSFITTKEAIEKIGGYNEEYFMYHDDIEVSWKTKLAGYKIILAPKSVVYHKYEFGRTDFAFHNMERNRYIAIFSFYKLPTILVILPALIAMDIGILLFSVINGWFGSKIKVYKYFARYDTWEKIAKARDEARKIRVKKDKEIIDGFTGQVLFQEINNPILKYIANPIFQAYWNIVRSFISW